MVDKDFLRHPKMLGVAFFAVTALFGCQVDVQQPKEETDHSTDSAIPSEQNEQSDSNTPGTGQSDADDTGTDNTPNDNDDSNAGSQATGDTDANASDDSGAPTDNTTVAASSVSYELENFSSDAGFYPFEVQSDTAASGAHYVVWPNNNDQVLDQAADNESGMITLPFSLTETANVDVRVQFNAADGSDDSFYFKLDSNSWETVNDVATDGWENHKIKTFTDVSAGEHRFSILRREDGMKLDVVTLAASQGLISDGASASYEVTIQENARGFCAADGVVETDHVGYTGNGYLDVDNALEADAIYSLQAGYATNVSLDVRFASVTSRPADVEVNGTIVAQLNFATTGAWTSWTNESVTVPLVTGENRIRLIAKTAEGLPNIDVVKAIGNAISAGSCSASDDGSSVADCNSITDVPVITVAKDGSGQFSTVQSAVNSVSSSNKTLTQIRIAPGIYKEKLLIDKPNLHFCGQTGQVNQTVLTYDDNAKTPNGSGGTLGTSGSTSISIKADDIAFENLTLENSYGSGSQAVAVRISADRFQARNARFLGYQDTLYVHGGSAYFRDCYVEGNTDYIFGAATAVFENCTIHNLERGTAITAPSTSQNNEFGLVFLGGELTAEPGVSRVSLGRNWRPYGAAAYLGVTMGEHISSVGWVAMGGNSLDTARFSEYNNSGPGADTSSRASQATQMTSAAAAKYTIENIFGDWVPELSKGE